MKVAITTWGSRGDFQPYLALAVAMQNKGHEVRLGAPPSPEFTELASTHGIEFVPLGPPADPTTLLNIANKAIATSNPVKSVRLIMDQLMLPAMDEMYSACLALANWSDVVVYHFFQLAGRMAAETSQRPFVSGTLVPTQIPTNRRPPGTLPAVSRWLNERLWKIAIAYMNGGWLGPVNEARLRVGLAPLQDVAMKGFYSPNLNLIAASPTVSPRPADWHARHRMTGYWLLPTPKSWEAPDPVKRFMEAGPPPVSVGFGSMTSQDSGALTRRVLRAVQLSGVRAVIEPGGARLGDGNVPSDILIAEGIPHSWLLPRVAASIHHGGAGTTAAAFHAGVPSVIVPHVFDQHAWAKRAAKMGVAPPPVPLHKLSTRRLASAIRTAVSSREMRERAQRLGRTLSEERGAARAVQLVEDYVQSVTDEPAKAGGTIRTAR